MYQYSETLKLKYLFTEILSIWNMASSPNYLFLYLITPLNISPLLTKRKVLREWSLLYLFYSINMLVCWDFKTL